MANERATIPVPPIVEITTPEDETGTCRVCGGIVQAEYTSTEVFGTTRIRKSLTSIYCVECGVLYKFLPPLTPL